MFKLARACALDSRTSNALTHALRSFACQEVVEAALNVATLKLEAELLAASQRVAIVLEKLPKYITPANLEELRRVKDVLVALEAKAEALEEVIEGAPGGRREDCRTQLVDAARSARRSGNKGS